MVEFLTISDELLPVAETAFEHFRLRGYDVLVEERQLAFPFTPALVCARGHETHIVEIVSRMDSARLRRWKTFGASQLSDTRITFVAPNVEALGVDGVLEIRQANLGILVGLNGHLVEIAAPADLAVRVALPELNDLPPELWPLLGPAYDRFQRGEWRDGLAEACQAVEAHARRYLADGVRQGRVVVLDDRGRVRNLTEQQVGRMTLGQLSVAFRGIQNRNHADSVISNILPAINPERVGLAHHRDDPEVEGQLRQNAGNHMHAIIACLEDLVREPLAA